MTESPPANRTLLLALLCVASFAVVFNNLIIAPLLPAISDDFGVKVAVAGLLVTAYALTGGAAAVFAGPILDRTGRRPVMLAGMGILAVATAASSVAPTFWALMASRAIAGLGVACLTPAVFAAVGDNFAYHERGKAMSWVISANTGASIFGIPVGAVVSGVLTWRLTFVLMASLCLVFTYLLYRKFPRDQARALGSGGGAGSIGRVLSQLHIAAALGSTYLWTSCWFTFVTYAGAYYRDEFDVADWALGGITMVLGTGVLIGSNAGGRLGDRIGKRPIIVAMTMVFALFMTLETTVAQSLWLAAVLFFVFSIAGGARFAAQQALLSEMAPAMRGTVMALNAACQQFGIVTGSLTGGLVLTAWDYTGIGPAAATLAVCSLLAYVLFVDERKVLGSAEGTTVRASSAR